MVMVFEYLFFCTVYTVAIMVIFFMPLIIIKITFSIWYQTHKIIKRPFVKAEILQRYAKVSEWYIYGHKVIYDKTVVVMVEGKKYKVKSQRLYDYFGSYDFVTVEEVFNKKGKLIKKSIIG